MVQLGTSHGLSASKIVQILDELTDYIMNKESSESEECKVIQKNKVIDLWNTQDLTVNRI